MSFLFENMDGFRKAGFYNDSLPNYISNNLNQNFILRPYQVNAFCNYINYFENDKLRPNPTQVLFHMATGSGKTHIMAGLIIYLHKQGYRNFLFFVHLDNIIQKTKDNFLNPISSKYLFAEEIKVDGEIIRIKEVDNFQGVDKENINICFKTIQGLHSDMWNVKENSLSIDDFSDKKIVLISDEAHHLNVDTRSSRSKSDIEDAKSWEYTANIIFGANRDNVLLEFTATCDLKHPLIKASYENKIIFDYPLKRFREDKYSKDVHTLQSDIPLMQRAMQAVLLSQYRLILFQEKGLNIKPVIMFKARRIQDSKDFKVKFLYEIKNLTVQQLRSLKNTTKNPTLLSMYEYFDNNGITFDILIQELKDEFDESRCISVNEKSEAIDTQLVVNSLEDKDNPYRAVFQVDKLNEGWDVLNLFDIVRLYETRDAKNGIPGKTTMSEAQLIGRGARYCPFILDNEDEKYTRKFDEDFDNPLKICEDLYYHCQYDSRYIAELNTALRETGIIAERSVQKTYSFKDDFKLEQLYKKGLVFYNLKKEKSRNSVFALPDYIKDKTYIVKSYSGRTTEGIVFNDSKYETDGITYHTHITIAMIAKMHYSLVHRALRKYSIYKFNTLKSYFPNLTSTREFILSDDYLGNIKLDIESNEIEPSMSIYYNACIQVLSKISESISDIEVTYEGTKEFYGKTFYEVFKDNQIVNYTDPHGDGVGISQNDPTISPGLKLDLSKEDWFVFNDNYGTSEEKAFVKYLKTHIAEYESKYDKIFLVRNERKLKIYSFEDGQRFEPDYLLFLHINKTDGYEQLQIFIEPKGAHLINDETWKEKLLMQLENEAIPVTKFVDDNDYLIWGFPFYNREKRQNEFSNHMNKLL